MRFSIFGRSAVVTVVVAVLFALFGGAGAASAAPAPAAPALSTPVTGTFTDASGGVGTVVGTFTPTGFAEDGTTALANGIVDLTLTDSAGQLMGTESREITAPVGVSQVSCEILDLVLGPLDLDLLGLVVHLDRVHLNITAEPGPGNLLGNLLCAIVGIPLPGSPAGLQALVVLLNQILALLNNG